MTVVRDIAAQPEDLPKLLMPLVTVMVQRAVAKDIDAVKAVCEVGCDGD